MDELNTSIDVLCVQQIKNCGNKIVVCDFLCRLFLSFCDILNIRYITKVSKMRYTADEERNKRCLMGVNYKKDNDSKKIIYDPSENHFGERDTTTMESIKNMLDIVAKEPGFSVETTLNGATFSVVAGMGFDDAWRAFKDALNDVPSVSNDREEKENVSVKYLDVPEVISRLSGIYVQGVDYDNPDVKRALKNMDGYSYDDTKDTNQNLVAAFPQYNLAQIGMMFREMVGMYKANGMDLNKICNRDFIVDFAKKMGLPGGRLSVKNDGNMRTVQQQNGARE